MQNTPSDYFSLLGLPRVYALDTDVLRLAYIEKQREFHPDRWARAAPEERAWALQCSADVNQAYRTLQSPLLRAEYLLKLEGIAEGKPSQVLLMESLEAREALMEAASAPELEAIRAEQQAALDAAYHYFATAYAHKDGTQAAEILLRLRYLEKLLEEIRVKGKMLTKQKEEHETPANT